MKIKKSQNIIIMILQKFPGTVSELQELYETTGEREKENQI